MPEVSTTSLNDGPESLFNSHSSEIIQNVAIAFTVLESIAVGLRFASLRLTEKRFGLDDFLTIPGYLCCIGLITISLVAINVVGTGDEILTTERIIQWTKCLYATPIIYAAACCFPRLTLLTLYFRIFEKHRVYRVACYTLMALIIGLAIALILVDIFICVPVGSLWSLTATAEDSSCLSFAKFYRYSSLPNPILDVMMLALPQPIVWKLQLSTQARIGLAVTFLTGSVGTITSIYRCVSFFTNELFAQGDAFTATFMMWSIIETGVYLIASCMPCYRPLIKFTIEHGRSISSRYHTKSSTVSSSGFRDEHEVVYNKPPQIPAAVIDSRTDLEMSESVSDPSHHWPQRELMRHSDEESLVDLEHRT